LNWQVDFILFFLDWFHFAAYFTTIAQTNFEGNIEDILNLTYLNFIANIAFMQFDERKAIHGITVKLCFLCNFLFHINVFTYLFTYIFTQNTVKVQVESLTLLQVNK
jgi:hypothetical protein